MEQSQFDVLVAGELNTDLILNGLGELPQIGKEILARDMTFTLGSSSAIFACNLSTLGANVNFIGKVGQDSFADKIIKDLEDKKVSVSSILFSRTAATGMTVALNYGQDRAMITYPGAIEEFTAGDVTDQLLRTARHLHVSSVFLQPGLRPGIHGLLARAKALGLTTSMDPQWDPAEKWDLDLPALLPYVDVFLPNLTELKKLTGKEDVHTAIEAIRSHAHIVAVKDGDAGAHIWDGKTLFHQRPFLNPAVIDSIGAGDSFNAGFIYKFIQHHSLQQCAEYGALTGAINTTASGGTTAFPDITSVKKTAAQKFNYIIP